MQTTDANLFWNVSLTNQLDHDSAVPIINIDDNSSEESLCSDKNIDTKVPYKKSLNEPVSRFSSQPTMSLSEKVSIQVPMESSCLGCPILDTGNEKNPFWR